MNVQFNIATLLKLNPDDRRATNRKIRDIVADSRLKDAGVSFTELWKLVHNQAQRLRPTTLAALLEYAVHKCLLRKSEVRPFLGGLFELAPEKMWSLLSERRRVELCMGVRSPKKPGINFVMAADPLLQAVVMNRMTEERLEDEWLARRGAPHWPGLDPNLIRTWKEKGGREEDIQKTARKFYQTNFEQLGRDVAILHIGTVKSCPTIEMSIAHAFLRAQAFTSEDDKELPADRSCPFALIYRDTDPKPPSCHAGERLSQHEPGDGPGIYYETDQEDPSTEKRTWARLPWDEQFDCAMVFYRYIKAFSRVEMILGGYSGRATRCLADYLQRGGAAQLWPPVFSDGELEIGIFFLQFTFDNTMKEEMTAGGLKFRRPISVKTIKMDSEVIDDRVREHRN